MSIYHLIGYDSFLVPSTKTTTNIKYYNENMTTINSHHEFPFSVYGLEHGLSEVGQRRLLGGHPESGGKVRKHCDPSHEHRGSFQQHHQPTNILHLKNAVNTSHQLRLRSLS